MASSPIPSIALGGDHAGLPLKRAIAEALEGAGHPVLDFGTNEAGLARAHHDANLAAFGARLIGPEVALDSLRTFLATPFDGGRHAGRVAKLSPPGPHGSTDS